MISYSFSRSVIQLRKFVFKIAFLHHEMMDWILQRILLRANIFTNMHAHKWWILTRFEEKNWHLKCLFTSWTNGFNSTNYSTKSTKSKRKWLFLWMNSYAFLIKKNDIWKVPSQNDQINCNRAKNTQKGTFLLQKLQTCGLFPIIFYTLLPFEPRNIFSSFFAIG